MKLFAGLFAGSFGLVWLVVTIAAIACWVHGIVLAFSASVVLGIVCIFLEVPFVIFGLVDWVAGVDLAQRIVQAFPGIFG
jgi:hypothetical protein